jgi:hypothetical protein
MEFEWPNNATTPPFDPELWVVTDHESEKGFIAGNGFTHAGRFRVYYPADNQILFTSEYEVRDASPQARAWIQGFMHGSLPDPPENREAFDVWEDEVRGFLASQGKWARLGGPGLKNETRSEVGNRVVTAEQLVEIARAFLQAVDADPASGGSVSAAQTDVPALAFGVSSNETAREIWARLFDEAVSRSSQPDESANMFLLSEAGSWLATQYFLENYPSWTSVDRVLEDLASIGGQGVSNPRPNEEWDSCCGSFAVIE